MLTKNTRPKYLNLLQIHQPVTAVVSIIHRLSGVILFLAIPPLIYFYAMSLRSEADFNALISLFNHPVYRIAGLLAMLLLLQHLVSGLRFLLLDLDMGLERKTARATAWGVFAVVAILFILVLAGRCQ